MVTKKLCAPMEQNASSEILKRCFDIFMYIFPKKLLKYSD